MTGRERVVGKLRSLPLAILTGSAKQKPRVIINARLSRKLFSCKPDFRSGSLAVFRVEQFAGNRHASDCCEKASLPLSSEAKIAMSRYLSKLAETEGFEPSVEVLAPTTV